VSYVAVVGAGVTGLTTAYRLQALMPRAEIVVVEADDRVGGKIHSSDFAGVPGVDEGADAFLIRVPHAMQLAADLGLGGALTSPAVAAANVWWNGLHRIPEGLLLGVPTDLGKLARSHLLTWPGKLRAGLEPILPATGVGADSVGLLIRKRFGRQVHERLVDPLVGSIYAADTERFSLAGVPQILDLATQHRSLLLGARRLRAKAPPVTGPIFATPTAGMGALTDALAASLRASGVIIRTGQRVTAIEPTGRRWFITTETVGTGPGGDVGGGSDMVGSDIVVDAVVMATPARSTAPLLGAMSADAASLLGQFDHAGVVMVTLALDATDWPRALHESSGYLVPKPVQKWVTAASFATSKWPHWRATAEDGSSNYLLRISLGRDGRDVTGEHDDALLDAALNEVGHHVGLTLQPTAHRIARWPMAFPQYRPGHADRVTRIERALARDAPGVFVAGASYHGIGIPACVRQGGAAAIAVSQFLDPVRD
jgi:protoporphyrinogen/coproporphyrinogen III oxidase